MSPLFGTPNIDKLKAQGDTKGLIKAVNHKQSEIRMEAVKALGVGIGLSADAANALLGILCNDHDNNDAFADELRAAAAIALGAYSFPVVVSTLNGFLKDNSANVRMGAVMGLARIGNLGSLDPLVESLEMDLGDTNRTKTKVNALFLIAKKHERSQWAVDRIMGIFSRQDISAMTKFAIIGSFLDSFGPATTIPLLIEMFKEHGLYAKMAREILVKQVGNPSVPFLKKALNDSDEKIRNGASDCLFEITGNRE